LTLKLIKGFIPLDLYLSLKAMEKLLKDCLGNLFENLVVHLSFVLDSLLFVVLNANLQEIHALLREVTDWSRSTFNVQIGNLVLNQLKSFVFDLVATILSHHLSLVWQVQLLLVLDHCPGSVDEVAQPINWNSLRSLTRISRHLGVEAVL
jgi:hypothetical protein